MQRMSEATRKQAATDLEAIRRVVEAGVQCDHCEARATIPVCDGITSHAYCHDGYRAHLAGARAERAAAPTRYADRFLAVNV